MYSFPGEILLLSSYENWLFGKVTKSIYDDNESYICDPFLDTGLIQDLNEKSSDEIKNAMNSSFYKIYLIIYN